MAYKEIEETTLTKFCLKNIQLELRSLCIICWTVFSKISGMFF